MFLHKLFILGLCAVITASDVFHTVDDYRELRLQHLKRQRRQQPKEISISLTAPLFTSRLFDYGADAGDQELPSGLDVGIKVDLKNPIKIDSGEYQSAFILGNGGVGFDAVSRTYRPNIFSKDSESTPMIVPFWNRNDLRKGGHVWFREISSGRILERGQSEIRYQYDKNVKVLSCLLVTWDRMQPLGNSVLDEENANVFQAAFFFTANHTYVNFIYNNIGWTQGAEAGFVSNKHSMDFSLPTSGTENIMYLEEYGNTGIPGEWMFELQPHRVIRCKAGIKGDICDEECSKGEYGEDCAQCCHCSGVETCNPISGQCPEQQCADCWYGPTCHLKDAVCHDQERNSCVRNAVAYFSMNNCNEQVVECNCLQGYQGDGKVECVDIDECKQEGTCHENAVCTNTPGHFLCQCMEGFTGDGVTECIASFLFPSEGHQELPKSRNAKVSFTLKHPLLIFGKPRNNLIVSNTGLVIVEELSKVRSSDTLDDMKVVGVAPFFGPIDLSRGGKITIAEATEHDILERASKKINQNLEQPTFEATSAVIITYSNVSALDSPASNTFQALVIGGKNKRGENLSFTMILYKNLIWSAGAEAGIMTFEKTNSIHLPGSGTEGIEQLSQLSNIREPGTWLYRIDQESVFPCMQLELQPPYCDAQSPTLVHSNRQSTSFVQQKTTVPVKNTATEFVSVSNSVQQHAKQETAAPPLASKTTSQTSAEKTREPVKQSTVHRPIVSIDPTDFEDLPDDAFAAVSFPPFVTVVPSIFSNEQQKTKPPMPSLVFPETRAPSSAEAPTRQTGRASTPAPAQNKPYKPNVDFSSNEDIDFAPVSDVAPTERPSTIKQVHQPPVVIPHNVPDRVEYTKSRTAPTAAPSIESSTPLRIFPTTKAPKQITKMPKTNPTVSTVDPQSDMFDLDSNQVLDAEGSSGNKTAIIVPTAIVVVWVCLLVLIALFICCKRRRANREFHPMYGPNFGGQPIATGFAMRKASKGYDSSYEDNIEKSAARLSAEMNSFNGRYGYGARY